MNRFLLIAFFAINAFSQDTKNTDFSIIESFSVQAGSVDVVVTDQNGNRVQGLDQESFSVLVDGKAIHLNHFEEVLREDLAHIQVEGSIQFAQEAPQQGSTKVVGTNYLIFIDDWFTKRQYRAPLLKRLRKEVSEMSDNDKVAIVRYYGEQLENILPYTNDKNAINKALTKLNKLPTYELKRHTQFLARLNNERSSGSALSRTTSDSFGENPVGARFLDRGRAFQDSGSLFQAIIASASHGGSHSLGLAFQEYFEQVQKTANAIELAMRGFNQKEGRNSLILVSEGWTSNFKDLLTRIPENAINSEYEGDPTELKTSTTDANWVASENRTFFNSQNAQNPEKSLKHISQTANLLGYTVYPMLISQIDHGTFMGNETNPTTTSGLLGFEYASRFDSVEFLAEETGGQVLSKAHRLKLPMTQVMADQKHYYRMSFNLPQADPGTRHDIQVLVSGDYELRHRKAFRQRAGNERQQLITQAAMLTGMDAGGLDVKFGQAQKHLRGKHKVPFDLTIPTNWITVLKDGENFNVQLELTVAAMDKRGNQSPMLATPINFSGKGNPTGDAYYDGEMVIRKKAQRLVFAIHDKVSNESITKTVDYKP